MSFLRLGTACAVFDDAGRVLLSRRGDMGVWNLPTGRLDTGETLADAAVREAREETGVVVTVERPVGLYYFAATRRLNVLYSGFPVGGELTHQTDETTENRYFCVDALPENLFAAYMAQDAADERKKALHVHHTPPWEVFKLRLKLARRYVVNLLRGRPEPKHVRFDVKAVGVLWDEGHRRVLTLPGEHGRVLPFVTCDGRRAPWDALRDGLRARFGAEPVLTWVGVWQHPAQNALEFVFAATVSHTQPSHGAEWTLAQNAALIGRDAQFVAHISPNYPHDPVWTVTQEDEPAATRIIIAS